MSIVIPAILPSSRADLEDKLAKYRGVAQVVQVDVVDGKFASPATWPYAGDGKTLKDLVAAGGTLPYLGHFRYEIDLMVSNPEETIGMWIDAGASRIVIHVESTTNLEKIMRILSEDYGHDKSFAPDLLAIGFALNIKTDSAILEPFIDRIDYVQFMGIETVGKQGQPFAPAVVPKIHAFKRKHPDMIVQVDGGVSLTTAPKLLEVGTNRLVIGSTLLHAVDPIHEMSRFDALAQMHGLYE
jgi:ribulose-phosphate 3-epimerase